MLEDSIAFYVGLLDFKVQEQYERTDGVKFVFLSHRAGAHLELVSGGYITGGSIGPGAPVMTFMVDSVADMSNRLTNAGKPVPPARILPSGLEMLRFDDPNGVTISLVSAMTIREN